MWHTAITMVLVLKGYVLTVRTVMHLQGQAFPNKRLRHLTGRQALTWLRCENALPGQANVTHGLARGALRRLRRHAHLGDCCCHGHRLQCRVRTEPGLL